MNAGGQGMRGLHVAGKVESLDIINSGLVKEGRGKEREGMRGEEVGEYGGRMRRYFLFPFNFSKCSLWLEFTPLFTLFFYFCYEVCARHPHRLEAALVTKVLAARAPLLS